MTASLQLNHLTFAYEGQEKPLFSDLSLSFSPGWTGLLGANGVGKSTLLQVATGHLPTPSGVLSGPEASLYLPQRVEVQPAGLDELLCFPDNHAGRLAALLELGWDWPQRWASLSPGERKRAQVAWALWRNPPLLALDEPSNHLDQRAKGLLVEALKHYRGIGLLVSHDRDLLDALCTQVVWIEREAAPLWGPSLKQVLAQQQQNRQTAQAARQQAQAELKRLQREAGQFRDQAGRSHQLRSKGRVAPKDHDAKAKINLARITGKDGQAGRRLNQLQGRLNRAQSEVEKAQVAKEYSAPVALQTSRSGRDLLVNLPAGHLHLGGGRRLSWPKLQLKPGHKVCLSGVNGAGKSRLLAHIQSHLSLPDEAAVYLPQEPSRAQQQAEVKALAQADAAHRGQVLALTGRLGAVPQALWDSASPSPGELKKLALAHALCRRPALLLLDEPTNHLDLPATLALEGALSAFQGAWILVTHDQQLAQRLCDVFWRIEGGRLELD